jgi:hypothetical protein
MVISGYSQANALVLNSVSNPAFGYLQAGAQPTSQDVVFQPDPIQVPITVQVPSITQDGVTVDFPPFTQIITVTPPPVTRSVPILGVSINPYECVGVIQTNPIRLCALIKPTLIALANHYPASPGEAVIFYGKNGVVTATIKELAATFGDLDIWRLQTPVTDITPARLASDMQIAAYISQPIVSFGLVGSRNITPYNWIPVATDGRILRAIRGTGGVMTCTCMLLNNSMTEPGDSGSPNFFMWNSVPFYLGADRKMGSTFEVNMVHPWIAQLPSP